MKNKMKYIKKIKSPIKVGFPLFQTNRIAMKKTGLTTIGYKVIQLTYDSPEMDCLISEKEISRFIYPSFR